MEGTRELLRLEGISKQFNQVEVLKNVAFDLLEGEVHALVGENGAGKSTLIKIISGVYAKDGGRMFFQGEEVVIHTPHEAFARGISTIHQEFNLVPYLDAPSNIFLGREPVGKLGYVKKKEIYRNAESLFERIGYRLNLRVPVKRLSVAERQMVEICKALSLNIRLLIMDEPTAVLSNKEIGNLFNIVRTLKSQGISIIYISHRLDELFEIADRVTVLRDGARVGTVPVQETSKSGITRMMIGRDLTEQYPREAGRRAGPVVLEARHLTGGLLKDISFELRKGEILGISGLVGAGRSELAHAIFGAYPLHGGEVLLEGRRIVNSGPSHSLRNGIALLPEDRKTQGLVLSLDNEKNLTLPNLDMFNRFSRIDGRRARAFSLKMMEDLQVRPLAPRKRTRELSGGNQQKIVIGKWLARKYKVILFDEPTRGVDVGAKVDIYRLMIRIADTSVGVIMISSDLPEILGMSDRVMVMREGRIQAVLDNDHLSEEDVIQHAFDTQDEEGKQCIT